MKVVWAGLTIYLALGFGTSVVVTLMPWELSLLDRLLVFFFWPVVWFRWSS